MGKRSRDRRRTIRQNTKSDECCACGFSAHGDTCSGCGRPFCHMCGANEGVICPTCSDKREKRRQ